MAPPKYAPRAIYSLHLTVGTTAMILVESYR